MRPNILHALQTHPEIATRIAKGLCEDLRKGSKKFITSLLEQQQQDVVNVPAVLITAAIESYYQSALNAMLNTRLTGVKVELFPNMHIQVPVRVSYICGFKGLRGYFYHHVDRNLYAYPNAVRLATAVLPGIVARTVFATLCPRGLAIRTTQTVGSFMILNGVINYLQLREHSQIQHAIGNHQAS
jgi:hypothetical protein